MGVLVGAGDIAECGVPGAEATARLLDAIEGVVFAAGDTAYFQGTPRQFAECYDPTWGRHKFRTRPIPGNHEYETPGASGYYGYFGAAAAPDSPGFYSFEVGPWQVVAVNSVIAVDAGSPQIAWLRNELARSRARCTLALVHHPYFSSGVNGGEPRMRPVWDVLYEHNVEVVVSGDDHVYERFAPQDPSGRSDPIRGLRLFVVGTGGATLTRFTTIRPNSEVRGVSWGVLKFTLRDNEYQWEFIPVAGATFRDAGSGVCH